MKRINHRAGRWSRRLQGATLLALTMATGLVHGQIVGQWTHQSSLGFGMGESSTAVGMFDGVHMYVGDNEDEILRLYVRFPGTACAAPFPIGTGPGQGSFDARPFLNLVAANPELDLEASTLDYDEPTGTYRIYWLGSHSNSMGGNDRPNRRRLFATTVNGNGSGNPPYTLTYVGRYDGLRTDLLNWDSLNLHGKGANYYGLVASAFAGGTAADAPENIDGFNIEGLVMAPDNVTAYIAFRAPLINDDGPSVGLTDRTNALIVPLLNMRDLVAGSPSAGPARFGEPIEIFLGGRGIRSIDKNGANQYLIVAGPWGNVSNPPQDPSNFRLYTWNGDRNTRPVERQTDIPAAVPQWGPEGIVSVPYPLDDASVIQFVSDDGPNCWRSFTANPGACLPILTNGLFNGANFQFTLIGRAGSTYTLSRSDNGAAFAGFAAPLNVTVPAGPPVGSVAVTDTTVPAGVYSRRYRAATLNTAWSRSGNAVGFSRLIAPVAWSIFANHFDNLIGNRVADLIPVAGDGDTIYKFDDASQNYTIATYFGGWGWEPADVTLGPGEAAWLSVSSPLTVSFIGQVPEGNLSVPIPSGFAMRSSKVAQSGGLQTVLGFDELVVGDKIYRQASPGVSTYNVYTNTAAGWMSSAGAGQPVINIGEGFFVERPPWSRAYKAW